MKENEKKDVIKRYSERLKEFGVSPKTLGWDKERHFLRYHILLSQFNFQKDDSLLDFGCGFGDMFDFCKKKNLDVNYFGVDINPDLIKEGQMKYPEIHLSAIDFLKDESKQEYDYIVSSGVHNLKLIDNWEFINETFEKFNQVSRKGFALNFISNQVDTAFKKDHLYYTDPTEILKLAYSFYRRVVLRNDYMPFEFTIFIDKSDKFNSDKVVYQDYLKYC
jgi:hypothetical protein